MGSMTNVVQQLRKERQRAQKEVHRIDAALAALGSLSVNGTKPKRILSAAARRRISLAQKKRWAKQKTKPRRSMSAAGRRRIAATQRARWAKAKAQQQKKAS